MEAKKLYVAMLSQMEEQGVEDAGFDTLQLLEHHTGITTAGLLANPKKEVPVQEEQALWQSVNARCAGKPLQYILGSWEFYSLPFSVGEGVLIPRADTEVLVDEALRLLEGVPNPQGVDLCSGSGCIAIAIAKNREDAKVVALELSSAAAAYCETNIKQNNAQNVTLVQRDLLQGPLEWEQLDFITANPPYISRKEMQTLSREVQQEPQMALFGGEDGLDFYRFIISHWADALKNDGFMALEVGYNQSAAVEQLLQERFEQVYIVPDLNNIPRVLIGVSKKI